MTPQPYQLLDPLRPDEYASLKADIAARGVLIPAEEDETGNTLDGHHRKAIAAELGIPCPVIVRRFATEREKREHVIRINLSRRHLDPIRWGKAFALLLQERGVRTDRGPKPQEPISATVAEIGSHQAPPPRAETVADVAAELGVSERTARHRVLLARKYDALPVPEKAAVDAGEKTVHKAHRQIDRRQKLEAKAAAAPEPDADAPPWEIVRGEVGTDESPLDFRTERARLVFADPPYNIGFEYGEGHNDRMPRPEYLAWCERWIGECARSLTPDGAMWVLINDECAAEFKLMLDAVGLHLRNWVIWYESFGVNCTDQFNRTHRHLLYFVRDPANCVFNFDAVSRPSDRQVKYHDARASAGGKVLDDVWFDVPRLVGTAAERLPDFPTQLPVALLLRIVGCCSGPGDLVVDPFNGSGTTGVACVRLGRRYLGVERSAANVERACNRLKGERRETV